MFTAGASLVQWNKLNGNVLASANDTDVRIWDMRVSGAQAMIIVSLLILQRSLSKFKFSMH